MIKKLYFILGLLLTTSSSFAQTVMLDYYFNHETKQDANRQPQRFHYLWEDTSSTGFSIWGQIFKHKGATLRSLNAAPTTGNLKGASVYIIVDPDSKKENPNPNFITDADAKQISNWVNAGGILILMANDSANVELPHFNILAGHFGLHFNNDMQNHVVDDDHFNDGAVLITNHPIFQTSKKLFLKDICSIALSGKAIPVLKTTNGAVIAATTKYGKGFVFAIGDPWLYNEYVNGRLPAAFDNNHAADDLVNWALALARNQ
ncbi:hypothetical protein A0256_20380 [Mucilaginibacter sp. PAMC 26640]|nr:hypothetical protein A0256_20380 [Mucilaginibacter sp. PAMC 26640]